jgi:hypothetical protein
MHGTDEKYSQFITEVPFQVRELLFVISLWAAEGGQMKTL